MTDLENNLKIKQFMNDKVNVDEIKRLIKQRQIEIDNLICELDGRKFSYETHNYDINNKPFFKIHYLRSDIKLFESMLSKEQQQLENSEAEAKGLEWIV
jgi:hypothetical protein